MKYAVQVFHLYTRRWTAGGGQAGHRGGGGAQKCVSFSVMACDPIALEFGVTVISRHRPWACPKRAPHFQVEALGIINLRNLYTVGGEEAV